MGKKYKEEAYLYMKDRRTRYYRTKDGRTFSITDGRPDDFIMYYGNVDTDKDVHRQATKEDLKNIKFVEVEI